MRDAALCVVLIGSIVTATACGSSPTTPSSPASPTQTPTPLVTELTPAPPTFQHLAGTWKGFMKMTETTEGGLGETFPFTLRIAGDPQSYTGEFDLPRFDNMPILTFNSGVAGRLREDGFAVLSGSTTVGSWSLAAMEVPELIVKTDDASGLAGTIRFVRRGTGRIDRYKAQILSASLQPSSAYPGGPMEGHWVGEAIVRACSGFCNPLFAAKYTREIELVLRQSDDTLSGSGSFGGNTSSCGGLCWLPLAGSAQGHSITSLTGRLAQELPSDWSGDRLMILSDFSATVDDLGRMHAQFVYSTEGQYFQGDPHRPASAASRITMESVWLTREP